MTALAWNLKAWLALWTMPPPGRRHEQRRAENELLLKMEFRTFVAGMIRLPCQIVRTSRKLVYRLLAWNRRQGVFFRLVEQRQRGSNELSFTPVL
jgi:hypothetical protein